MKSIRIFAILLFMVACNQEPPKLSEEELTLEVSHLDLDCDCPNFIETKNNAAGKGKEADRIYLEAANEVVLIPEKHYGKYNFSVRGHFYEEEGIPLDYKAKTDDKPKKGRIFKYDTYELIKK